MERIRILSRPHGRPRAHSGKILVLLNVEWREVPSAALNFGTYLLSLIPITVNFLLFLGNDIELNPGPK